MQYSTILSTLAMATSILAAPTPDALPTNGKPFGVAAVGCSIQNQGLTASKGRVFIGGTQDTQCDNGQFQGVATFVKYSDNTVFLYKLGGAPQQLWVDASGMGGGITGYSTGDVPAPENASFSSFDIDANGLLTFNGVGAKACPTTEDGQFSLWFTESEKPGNQDGCEDVELTAFDAPARIACTYSS